MNKAIKYQRNFLDGIPDGILDYSYRPSDRQSQKKKKKNKYQFFSNIIAQDDRNFYEMRVKILRTDSNMSYDQGQ